MLKAAVAIAGGLALAAGLSLLVACSDDDVLDLARFRPTVSPTPAPTREPPTTAELSEVQRMVDVLRTRDAEQVRPLIGFRSIACSATPTGPGGPPRCASGEENGEQIEAFYLGVCEGEYVRRDEIDRALDIIAQTRVYGAYQVPAVNASAGDFAVVLIDEREGQEPFAWEAIVDDGEIVGLLFSCALSAEELVELRGYGDPILRVE